LDLVKNLIHLNFIPLFFLLLQKNVAAVCCWVERGGVDVGSSYQIYRKPKQTILKKKIIT